LLQLNRLNSQEIQALSVSMIGEAGKDKAVLQLLEKETEGNVFFIVEVMRTLANTAGQLDQIAEMTLPARVFAGGIQSIIQHRLRQVPESAISLLLLAAADGKFLDLDVLRSLNEVDDLDTWLAICANHSVLEVQNNRWLFSHDKLRDGLLLDLSSAERHQLHLRLAHEIEAVHAKEATQLARLAYHWQQVLKGTGTPERSEMIEGLNAIERAAIQAQENNAHTDALSFLQSMLDSATRYETVYPVEAARRSRWHLRMSQIYYYLRRFDESDRHIRDAAALAGYPIPKSQNRLLLGITGQLLSQLAHRALPVFFLRRGSAKREELLHVARVDQFSGRIAFVIHQQLQSLYAALHALNISERAGESAELAEAYGLMATIAGNLLLPRVMASYYRKALEIGERSANDVALANILLVTGIANLNMGDFERVERDLTRASMLFEQVGDALNAGYARVTLGSCHLVQGRYAQAQTLFQTVVSSSAGQLPVLEVVSHTMLARIALIQSDLVPAYTQIQHALDVLKTQDDPQVSYDTWAIAAVIHAAREEYLDAWDAANRSMEFARAAGAGANLAYVAYSYLVDVYRRLLQVSDHSPVAERQTLLQKAAEAVKVLTTLTPPTGQPAASRARADLLHLQGNAPQAQKQWRKSLEQARQYHMPLDEGLALLRLGDTQAAQAILARIGANHYLAQS
jgi:tetratricopeptide (TPR) repeat protein